MQLRNIQRHLPTLLMAIFAATVWAAPVPARDTHVDASRIVSIGGTVTEIIYELGDGDRVVAIDSTSTYPAEAQGKPNVGYMRQISPEGVIAQKPDLILAEGGAGPADALAILKAGKVPLVSIPTPPTVEGIGPKIRAVGAAIGKDEPAATLAASVEADIARLRADIATLPVPKKRVLFALSLANGRIMAAGAKTAADAMIGLAGGINAASAAEGYKPMTDEAVIAAAPDVILVMANGGAHITAEDAFAIPALQSSPAGRDKAFIAMEGLYLLGLGPRTAGAGRELADKLYPGALPR